MDRKCRSDASSVKNAAEIGKISEKALRECDLH